jgi:hypothetical protein
MVQIAPNTTKCTILVIRDIRFPYKVWSLHITHQIIRDIRSDIFDITTPYHSFFIRDIRFPYKVWSLHITHQSIRDIRLK